MYFTDSTCCSLAWLEVQQVCLHGHQYEHVTYASHYDYYDGSDVTKWQDFLQFTLILWDHYTCNLSLAKTFCDTSL